MSRADRVARLLVRRAARRWPAEVAGTMAAEWQAEIDAMRASGAPAVRVLAFAGSLAVSPAVEPEGAEPVPRLEAWCRSLAAAVGATLLAAALFNGVHVVQHRAGAGWAFLALAAAAAVMAAAARGSRAPVLLRTVAVGAALFGFLLAGNRISLMPFMGWADILPAVLAWTGGTALTAHCVVRSRRRRLAPLVAVAGALATLEIATVAGSLHAATELGVGLGTAAGWFPLSLLPGGAVTFGPVLPGGVHGSSPGGVHASELLLGNASAMAGPMLLALVFVLARALWPAAPAARGAAASAARGAAASAARGAAAPAARGPAAPAVRSRRLDLSVPLGVAAAVAALVVAEVVRRVPEGSIGVTLHRLIDNSTVFGFGFVEHMPGRIVLALVAGLVAAQVGAARRA